MSTLKHSDIESEGVAKTMKKTQNLNKKVQMSSPISPLLSVCQPFTPWNRKIEILWIGTLSEVEVRSTHTEGGLKGYNTGRN